MTIEEIWQSLERFNIRRFQLPNRVDRSNFNVKDDNYLVLKICIFGAFFPNYFGKLIFLVMFEICYLFNFIHFSVRNHGLNDQRAALKSVDFQDPLRSLFFMGITPGITS